jgi:hypothetical protein
MKTKKKGIVVAALITSLAFAVPAFAQGGPGKGQAIQKQTKSMKQIKEQKRLRDGSCAQAGTPLGQKAKKGSTYGPGDGTGYGAPTNQ